MIGSSKPILIPCLSLSQPWKPISNTDITSRCLAYARKAAFLKAEGAFSLQIVGRSIPTSACPGVDPVRLRSDFPLKVLINSYSNTYVLPVSILDPLELIDGYCTHPVPNHCMALLCPVKSAAPLLPKDGYIFSNK